MPKSQQILSHTGLGSQSFDIKHDAFIKGMSTSDQSEDFGFSPLTTAVNLIYSPGQVFAPAPATSLGNINTTVIATSDDPTSLGKPAGNSKYLLVIDGNAKGYYLQYNSGTGFAVSQTDTTANRVYAYASSDLVAYNVGGVNNLYATTNGLVGSATNAQDVDIVQWNGDTTVDLTWWSGTKSKTKLATSCPHPMIVFNKILYIANKNTLASWDGTTATDAILTLSGEQTITSLGIDPNTGKMLVGVSIGANFPDTIPTSSFIGLYDGFNPTQFVKKIPVEDQVTMFRNCGGYTYVAYGKNIGYFTGSGVKFLRRLSNATYATGDLPYKHHVTAVGNTFYIVDGTQILAFGPIVAGGDPRWYPAYKAAAAITALFNLGSGQIGFQVTGGQFVVYSFDPNAVATTGSSMTFYSGNEHPPRPIFIRGIDVILSSAVASGSHAFSLIDDKNITTAIGTFDSSASTTPYCRFPVNIGPTTNLQIKDVVASCAVGLQRILIYYDAAE